jgi:hypothetical protein
MIKHVRKIIVVKLPYVSSNEEVVVDVDDDDVDDKDGKTTKDVEDENEEEEDENKDGKNKSPSNHDQDGINCNA